MGPVCEGRRCVSVGQSIVQQVIERLRAGGVDAIRAYPAEKLTELTGVRAAVSLKSMDPGNGTATVQICVCGPASEGGSFCEDAAARICMPLRDMGAHCSMDQCRQLGQRNIFGVDVSAVFYGWDAGGGWENLAVSLAGTKLTAVRAFKAWRSIGEAESLGTVQWKFRIEETLPPEASEGAQVTEPFAITVTRGNRTESYSGCKLTYHRCEASNTGLRRIRQGVAQSRTVSG